MKHFRGGCHDCGTQDKMGIVFCTACCNFLPDWDLPDLHDKRIMESSNTLIAFVEKAMQVLKDR